MSGLRRSLRRHRVDDRDLPADQLLVDLGLGDLRLHLGDARQLAEDAAHAAHLGDLLQLASAGRRGRSCPWPACWASFSASSLSTSSAAFSTSDTTSPMSRMREATRSGWNGSSASSFSPMPTSLIGLPVTARMLSAAPPRASPSMRVSTMPVRSTRSWNWRGDVDRVLAGQRVGHQQGLVRPRQLAHRDQLVHQRLVDMQPAGGVEDQDVVALAPRRLQRAPGDLQRLLALDDRQARHLGLLRQHLELVLGCRAAARRARPPAPSSSRAA